MLETDTRANILCFTRPHTIENKRQETHYRRESQTLVGLGGDGLKKKKNKRNLKSKSEKMTMKKRRYVQRKIIKKQEACGASV